MGQAFAGHSAACESRSDACLEGACWVTYYSSLQVCWWQPLPAPRPSGTEATKHCGFLQAGVMVPTQHQDKGRGGV